MANQICFLHDRLAVQPIPINRKWPVVPHHEIAGAKARQVVKEVRTLTEFDVHLRQSGFHNCPRSRNLAPSYRNAQRRMETSPPPETNQQEWPMLVRELPVDRFQVLCD